MNAPTVKNQAIAELHRVLDAANEDRYRLRALRDELAAALQATLKALQRFTRDEIHFPATVPEVEAKASAALAKVRP